MYYQVLYFREEGDYNEVLESLRERVIKTPNTFSPHLIMCEDNLEGIDIKGAEILTDPIKPSTLESMAENVIIFANAFVTDQIKLPTTKDGLKWDTQGYPAPQ